MNLNELWNRETLNRPIEDTSLQWFRMGFGLLLAYYFIKSMLTGLMHLQYIQPKFQFTYPGFDWVSPLPGNGMYWVYGFLALASLCLAFGWVYRIAAISLFISFAYIFLLDVARYQNHLYFVLLLCVFFVFLPHPGTWSQRFGKQANHSKTIPLWWLLLFQFQIGIVYFFGGIAKINQDWLIRAEPMTTWLKRDMAQFIPEFFLSQGWFPYFMSWGGMLLDLLLFPALVWRRTRPFVMIAMLLFHLSNAVMFHISIFPWLMIWATFLFWSPHWPKTFFAKLKGTKKPREIIIGTPSAESTPPPSMSRVTLAMVAIFCILQLLIPLRHWIYPGDVSWTEEGHRFSWRMKLREKQGSLKFFLLDREQGKMIRIHPENLLDRRQISKMTHDPHLIRQFCARLKKRLQKEGQTNFGIKVISSVSLNSRPAQPLVDLTVDMANLPKSPNHCGWIVPLRPLPKSEK